MIGPFGQDDADYFKEASIIRETAEIPVKASPLQGTTLTTLLGGSGTAAVLEVFHNGVTPAEATVSILFVAGAMIFLGTANAVRRALEAGLERKLLRTFGVEPDNTIAKNRDQALARNKTALQGKEARARSAGVSSPQYVDETTAAYATRDPSADGAPEVIAIPAVDCSRREMRSIEQHLSLGDKRRILVVRALRGGVVYRSSGDRRSCR